MASAKFYISYLIGNNKSSPWKSLTIIVKNSASGNEFMESELIDKVKIILPLNDEVGEK